MSQLETAGARRLAEQHETECEAGESYEDFLRRLAEYLTIDPKKFRRSVNRVAPLLSGDEQDSLKRLSYGVPMSQGDFEDQFEEICVSKSADERRELMRLWLRHL